MGGNVEETLTSTGFSFSSDRASTFPAMKVSIELFTSGGTRKRTSTPKTNRTTSFVPRPLKAPEPVKLLLPTSCVGGGSGGTGLSAFGVGTLAAR